MNLQTQSHYRLPSAVAEPEGFDFVYQTVVNGLLRETDLAERIPAADAAGELLLASLPEDFSGRDAITDLVRIPLESQGQELFVGVVYWSLTGRHQFALPVLRRPLKARDSHDAAPFAPLDLDEFLRSSLTEVGARLTVPREPEPDQLLEKIFNSRENIARFIRERAGDVARLTSAAPLSFIDSEQSLVIGHQTHPTAKAREGFSVTEMASYSPELRGRFPLHFFRVHSDLAHQDSAVSNRSAENIVKQMLRDDPAVPAAIKELCDGPRMILPVHPWQARYVQSLPAVQRLFRDGLLEDLGAAGAHWTPTTSVRTVFREDFEFMFKFSLNVKITNSVRVNLTRELDRSIEMARLMQTEYGRRIQADVPDFVFIQDPAYLGVKWAGEVIEPLSCTFREAAFTKFPDGSDRDITAITSLVQDHPHGHSQRNRLYNIIAEIAERERRPLEDAALEWYRRYLQVSIYNLFKLFFRWGLCFEAHGQNSLLELKDGYPVRYLYRDSQGYFHRAAAHADFCSVMPGLGEKTESIFPEDLANERLVYYLIINQVFSVINALGTQGLVGEGKLMREFAALLARIAREPARYPLDMIDHLQNNERLPCKSNLLTQLFNMDELVGDIATQSVYVDIENIIRPFAEERR